ncbi:MAG: TonB-dependent receptor [Bacteroidetes bacterium]|nr:TonB-dependent receptor [Bacteroidota bacterium]
MNKYMLLPATAIMAFVYTSVDAQDSLKNHKLDEVIIRQKQKATTISSISTLKTENIGTRELLKAACCNLSESFETTPSVDIAFTDAVTGYKQIQMLGLAGAYTSITRENIPDARGLIAITGLTFTPGTWIESMQLSKGTGSVVNGYESVAGQINVEWKKPFDDKQEKLLLNLYQSSQGRTEGNAVYTKKLNSKLSTNLFLHGRSQWLKLDENKDGFLDQPLDKQFIGANRWFWFGPNNWEVQAGVKAVYVNNIGGQWNYEKGTEQIAGNPWGFQLNMQRYEGWAKIGKILPRKATSVGLQLSAIHHQQDAVYGSRNYDALQNSFYANLIYQTYVGNTNHTLKAGASTLIDNYDENFAAQKYARVETVPGVFAEYAYNGKNWNLIGGLRADYHSIFGAFVTPRLHLRYAPFPRTVIRASVGRAQRTANIFAENMGYMASNRAFIIQTTETGKAYGLNPEVAWNMGVNLTQKFQLDYRDGSFGVDYYYTRFNNQIVVDVEDPGSVRFYNLSGLSFAHSLQGQFDYELLHNFDLRLAYRWYDVRTTYSGELKEKPLVAAHRAFANLAYETRNKWRFDVTVQWVGTKRIPSMWGKNGTTIMPDSKSPDFVMLNAQLSKTWKENFELYLGGENLTNYMMHHPVMGAQNPYGKTFDASMTWGPIMGVNVYAGMRWKLR